LRSEERDETSRREVRVREERSDFQERGEISRREERV